jgi:hypothetical protein
MQRSEACSSGRIYCRWGAGVSIWFGSLRSETGVEQPGRVSLAVWRERLGGEIGHPAPLCCKGVEAERDANAVQRGVALRTRGEGGESSSRERIAVVRSRNTVMEFGDGIRGSLLEYL